MTDINVPDRLSVDPTSPFFNHLVARSVRVFLDGVEHKNDVKEYCISEGWILTHPKDRLGRINRAVAIRQEGVVTVDRKSPMTYIPVQSAAAREGVMREAELKRVALARRQAKGMA